MPPCEMTGAHAVNGLTIPRGSLVSDDEYNGVLSG